MGRIFVNCRVQFKSVAEREFVLGHTSSAVQFCLLSSVGQKFCPVFSLIISVLVSLKISVWANQISGPVWTCRKVFCSYVVQYIMHIV